MSLLNYNNNEQSVLSMNVADMTSAQKRRAKELLKNMLAQLEGRPIDISEGSDMYVKSDGQVVYIDITPELEMDDDDQTKDRARMCRLGDMFMNAYIDVNDTIEPCEYDTIINDSVHDIDARIKDAENNLKALKKLIDIVKRARDNGATQLAVVDFNDFDKYGNDD